MAIRLPLQRRARPGGVPRIIRISGFKSLAEPGVELRLRKLTLLAGGNSSGKSAIMQPLLLMKQTLEAPYDPGPLLLDGPHARFTAFEQMLSRGKRRADTASAITVEFGPIRVPSTDRSPSGRPKRAELPAMRLRFTARRYRGLHQIVPPDAEVHLEGRWHSLSGMSDPSIIAELLRAYPMPDALNFSSPGALLSEGNGPPAPPPRIELEIERFEPFLAVRHDSVTVTIAPLGPHIGWLTSLLHLPGLRGHRDRAYKTSHTGDGRTLIAQGPFTEYVASVLTRWQASKNDAEIEALSLVNDALRSLGLTWKVQARPINAAQVELKVGRTPQAQQGGAQDLVDIADVGFGVSQVLPVVVALAGAVKNQLVYIEQPELHLHPRAQTVMGRLLVDAVARGVRVVVETHSKLILRSIQTAIAQGSLAPKDVALHWFSRDPATGNTRVDYADIDAGGGFGEWPVDFSEAEAEADDQWLDAVYARAGE